MGADLASVPAECAAAERSGLTSAKYSATPAENRDAGRFPALYSARRKEFPNVQARGSTESSRAHSLLDVDLRLQPLTMGRRIGTAMAEWTGGVADTAPLCAGPMRG
jgi:hypothetical protein